MTRWLAAALLATVVLALLLPSGAAAHGLVGRADLPLPAWLVSWAAALVLVLSFAALAALWPTPRLEGGGRERRLFTVPRWLDVLAGAIGVAILVLVVYAGLTGTQVPSKNLAPTVVYVLVWVGFVPVSLLFGDVFAAVNPWRAIGRLTGAAVARLTGSVPETLPYPPRLGYWPAAAGIFAFVCAELALADGNDPSTLALLIELYVVVQLAGQALFGVEAWGRHGDPLGVYFGLIARLAPLTRHGDALVLRRPLAGVTGLEPVPGTVALLAMMIGTTSFDGFSAGGAWNGTIAATLLDVFRAVGVDGTRGLELAFVVGIAAMVALVAAVYRLGLSGLPTADATARDRLPGMFAHSLVPIAVGYVLAHYFSLLVYQGQQLLPLASDPLGTGADYLGTATVTVDYSVISATGIWYVQAAVLVAGHIAGLVLAHDRALVVYSDRRRAVRSQYWLLAVMIAFTCFGLFLLSALDGS